MLTQLGEYLTCAILALLQLIGEVEWPQSERDLLEKNDGTSTDD